MNKEVLDFVVEKTKELMAAPSCSQEAKDAAQAWLDAVGTDRQEEETKKYIAELEEERKRRLLRPMDAVIGVVSRL